MVTQNRSQKKISKTLRVQDIPQKGLSLNLVNDLDWLFETLQEASGLFEIKENSISGDLNLNKSDDIININGTLCFSSESPCSKCGSPISQNESISINTVMAPEPTIDDGEEAEIASDDLNFSFYKDDEIDLHQTINDEVILALPYGYYCENTGPCEERKQKYLSKEPVKTTDPRWDSLKDLKKENKSH